MAKLQSTLASRLSDGRELTIRSAAPGDGRDMATFVDAIAAEPEVCLAVLPGQLGARDWKRRISAALADPRALTLVACVDGVFAGNLVLHPEAHPAAAHVRTLGVSVARGYRHCGIGAALLEAAVDWSERNGVTRLILGVFPHNQRAIGFYEYHGFVVEGRRCGQFVRAGKVYDEVLMARMLGGRT